MSFGSLTNKILLTLLLLSMVSSYQNIRRMTMNGGNSNNMTVMVEYGASNVEVSFAVYA